MSRLDKIIENHRQGQIFRSILDALISTTVPPVIFCNNGGRLKKQHIQLFICVFFFINLGTYNPTTGLCMCPAGYTGSRCETVLSKLTHLIVVGRTC